MHVRLAELNIKSLGLEISLIRGLGFRVLSRRHVQIS